MATVPGSPPPTDAPAESNQATALPSVRTSRDRIVAIVARVDRDVAAKDAAAYAEHSDELVSLVSAHAHASETALHSYADEAGLRSEQAVDADLERLRALEEATYALGHRLGGDMLAVPATASEVGTVLSERLREYLSAEQTLVSDLEQALEADQLSQADRDFAAALAAGPTRAHPSAPHGALGRPMRAVLGRWDRVLDVLNSRPGHGWRAPETRADD